MSLLQEYELLRRVPVFAEIEPAKLKLIAFMSERVGYDADRVLCRQGDPADAAFLIIEGEAEISRLGRLAFAGEVRGHPPEEGLDPLPSLIEGRQERLGTA